MPRFIDLDEIAPEPVAVRIAGVRYLLPGDIPVPDYFALDALSRRIIDDSDEDEDPTEAVTELHDRLLALFQIHQPDLEQLPVGPRLLLPLLFAYLNPDAGEHEDEADAAPPPKAGTTTKASGGRRTTPTTRRKPKVSAS